MSEVEQTPATAEYVAPPSEPVEQTEQVAADTTEPAVESDEQKNARELDERQKRSERASRGIQRRFDELTADKHAERQRADQLARTVEQLISMQQQGRGQPQGPSDNAPRREQFADYESFLDARAEFKAEQRANAALSNWQQQQATQAQQALAQYQEQQRIAEVQTHIEQFGKKAGAEWEQYVASADDVQLPDQFQRTVLAPLGSDAGALLLAIGKNPALAKQFWNRSPEQQLVTAAKIVAASSSTQQVSKAPPPGTPVGSKPGSASEPPTDPDAYMAWAAKHMR